MKTIRVLNAAQTNAVVISSGDGQCTSRLYVNVDYSKNDFGDATLISKKHSTETGAISWAQKVLEA